MKLKMILQKYVINNIGYKILAIVFSFLLWLVVLNITDPDYTKNIANIPVQIENEQMILDGTHVYTISSGETTSITVTGKRSIISTLSANDFIATADFAELSITNAVPITVELSGDKLRYSGQVTIIAKDTSMLINLEDMTSRQIPVELEYKGELAENIVIDEANISPKKVTISAPESITNSAEKVVVTANSNNINSDTVMYLSPAIMNLNGSLIKQEGDTSLDETEIMVEFKVSYKKDVSIKVTTSGTVAQGYQFKGIELSQDTILVKGPKSDIDSLNKINIPSDAVNIDEKKESFETEIDVTPYLPENVVVYGESPTITVSVLIEGPDETEDDSESIIEEPSETEAADK